MARAAKGDGGIYRHGDGWRVRVTIDGKRVERRAGSKAEANQIRKDLLAGGVIPKGWTVYTWMRHWLDNIADLTPKTMSGYEGNLERYIRPTVGHIKLEKLRAEHLEKLYGSMKDGTHKKDGKPLAGNTRAGVHTNISRALKVAQQRGHIAVNVATHVEAPSRGKPKTETLSLKDTQVLMRAAVGDDYAARWGLALMEGIRPGEALGLTWASVDGDQLEIKQQLQYTSKTGLIVHPLAKTASGERTITLTPFVARLLAEQRARQNQWRIEAGDRWKVWEFEGEPVPLVFTLRDGSPLRPRHDATLWARLLTAAGLPHTRPYTARHTAASLMIDRTGDVATVSEKLGHRDAAFTYRTYVHGLAERRGTLAQAMDDFDPTRESDPLSDPLSELVETDQDSFEASCARNFGQEKTGTSLDR